MWCKGTVTLLSLLPSSAAKQVPLGEESPSPLNPGFDDLVSHTLDKWRIPGLAIAIIDGDETYSKV